MCTIENFRELLDHEFPDFSHLNVNRYGYKVDGNNGIKSAIELNELKSVDYFLFEAGIEFLEFSDLFKQRELGLEKEARINESNLNKLEKKELKKSIQRVINKELIDKFKDTVHIKGKTDKEISDVPIQGIQVSKYIIVVAPINVEQNKADFVRFLDDLKSNIISGLPSQFLAVIDIRPMDKIFTFQ